MRIAVTGRTGQIARALLESGSREGAGIRPVSRPELDLEDPPGIHNALSAARPDVIVSAAAWTAVDAAEGDPQKAFKINAAGAGAVARSAKLLDIPVIQISTDYVFAGKGDRPHREEDACAPLSVYGRSKLEGERLVAVATDNHAILRVGWVYSPFGNNFLKTMLRLGENRDSVRVVGDQHGCPTSATDIASAILVMARRLHGDPAPQFRGIFHFSPQGETTWAGFARHIFANMERRDGKGAKVETISSRDYAAAAMRPANSRLANDKLRETYGISTGAWELSVDSLLERLARERGEGSCI